jgi:hypothetical protein
MFEVQRNPLNCIHQQNIFRKTNKTFFLNLVKDYFLDFVCYKKMSHFYRKNKINLITKNKFLFMLTRSQQKIKFLK